MLSILLKLTWLTSIGEIKFCSCYHLDNSGDLNNDHLNNGLQLAHYSDAWLISLTSHLSTFKLIIQITDTFVQHLGGGLNNEPFNNWHMFMISIMD